MLKVTLISKAHILEIVTDRKNRLYNCQSIGNTISAIDWHIYNSPRSILKVTDQGYAQCDCEYFGN